MNLKLRTRLVLAGATGTAMALIAGPAFADASGNGWPGDRLVPAPRPCVGLEKPGIDIRPPRPCLPDVPTPSPCIWNPDKIRCIQLPPEIALAASKKDSDLVPPIGPGPYNPIPEFPNDDIIVV